MYDLYKAKEEQESALALARTIVTPDKSVSSDILQVTTDTHVLETSNTITGNKRTITSKTPTVKNPTANKNSNSSNKK